jgi:hypothetical protein
MEPGATFYTSATVRDGRSDALLQLAEIVTAYRTPTQLERILRHIPWRRLDVTGDPTGLQTFVTAVR